GAQWATRQACPTNCAAGSCSGPCSDGDKDCTRPNIPRTCVAGVWQEQTACPFVCTGAGTCTGECVPGSRSCDGGVPRTCSADGLWVRGVACPFTCAGGEGAGGGGARRPPCHPDTGGGGAPPGGWARPRWVGVGAAARGG